MFMFIVGINGSPNKKGNTAFMLKTALEAAGALRARTAVIHIADALTGISQPFCVHCSTPCDARCYKGTPLEKALEVLREADGILVGSPVYFGTVSAQLKSFWDKTRLLRSEKALLNVVGGVLAVGASRFGGQETTVRAVQDMMLCQGMIVVGDGHTEEDAGHQGACAQRPSASDVVGLKRCHILAKRVVEVARATADLRAQRQS